MKKFHLHLDALIAMALVVVISLGVNFFQYRIYADLLAEYQGMEMTIMVHELNLDSMQKTIDKLTADIEAGETKTSE